MQQAYIFKVTLNRIKPAIWRRIAISSTATLAELHDLIQRTFGWENRHLYEFTLGDRLFIDSSTDDLGTAGAEDSRKTRLSSLRLNKGARMQYVYDFGDNWEHTIILEDVVPENTLPQLPYCLAGSRNAPPEDCGSIPGYEEVLWALKNPDHEDAQPLLDWLGAYDPEYFDINWVNTLIRKDKKLQVRKSGADNKQLKSSKSKKMKAKEDQDK